MDIALTPEIEALIRRHLAHGCSQTPESVLTKALHALGELEAMQSQDIPPTKATQEESVGVAEQSTPVLPLLQWRHETAGPRVGLNEVRRRLASIPGSMSDDIHEEREDRL
jgi:hypothetical protein